MSFKVPSNPIQTGTLKTALRAADGSVGSALQGTGSTAAPFLH